MLNEPPEYYRLSEESTSRLTRFAIGALVFLVALLVLTLIYLLGEKVQGFSWTVFCDGLLAFVAILLTACVAIALITVLLRLFVLFVPEKLRSRGERSRLRKARRKAEQAISAKEQLSEERVRLTAQMQATFLFEKETSATVNARASQEFRDALQAGIVRSCSVAYDQIHRVMENYEQLVREITESQLPDGEKTELLKSLVRQLDVAAAEQRNRDACRVMENEIWKVRFRKARLLAKSSRSAGESYLRELIRVARSPQLKHKLETLLTEISTGTI
ncbi:MAG: hypothetical protein KDA85_14605 [Planctomycetaceae bacterium]|nr:hypothetical protein [Planctomycetaceae bacterium]